MPLSCSEIRVFTRFLNGSICSKVLSVEAPSMIIHSKFWFVCAHMLWHVLLIKGSFLQIVIMDRRVLSVIGFSFWGWLYFQLNRFFYKSLCFWGYRRQNKSIAKYCFLGYSFSDFLLLYNLKFLCMKIFEKIFKKKSLAKTVEQMPLVEDD